MRKLKGKEIKKGMRAFKILRDLNEIVVSFKYST